MSYKLYNDKSQTFECQLSLEGGSLSKSNPRIVLEVNGHTVLYTGKLESSGKCKVEINNLRSLFNEKCEGTMWLEVISEGCNYFRPWEDKVEIGASKIMTVESIVQSEPEKPSKNKMIVSEVKSNDIVSNAGLTIIQEVVNFIKQHRLCETLKDDKIKSIITPVLDTYYKSINENMPKNIINEILISVKR